MTCTSASRFIDLYKALSVNPNASTGQIKSAFFKLAKSYHPDVNTSAGSDAKFKKINAAYQTLTKERASYDQEYQQHYGYHPSQESRNTIFTGTPFTSTFSQSPFCDPVSASSAFQWGEAWTKPRRRKQKEQQKTCQVNTKTVEHQEKRFDRNFFWSDYADMDEGYYNSVSFTEEGMDFHDGQKRYRKRDGTVLWEFNMDGGENPYLYMCSRGNGRQYQKMNDEDDSEIEDDTEFEFLNTIKNGFNSSVCYKPTSNFRNNINNNRLTRKILQRIRDHPKPSDVHLLKKFGVDVRDFGFNEEEEKKENNKVDEQFTEKTAEKKNESVKGKRTKLNDKKCSKEGSIYYDFKSDSFKWKQDKKGRDKVKDSIDESEFNSNDEIKTNKEPEKTSETENSSSAPEIVSVFTLASKRLNGKNHPGKSSKNSIADFQPLMDRSHKVNGNRIENEFFLNKAQAMKWLKFEGDSKRIYGLFENGSFVNNFSSVNGSNKWTTVG